MSNDTVFMVVQGCPYSPDVPVKLFRDRNAALTLALSLANEQAEELSEFSNMAVHVERPNRNTFMLVNGKNGTNVDWFAVEEWEID